MDLDIRQARVTSTFGVNLRPFFNFKLILMCNGLKCAGKRVFNVYFVFFLAGEEMHDKPIRLVLQQELAQTAKQAARESTQ